MDRSKIPVFTTKSILHHNKSILLVCHDEDGDWQFLPGTEINNADVMLVSLAQLIEFDPTVESVLNMPMNSIAIRKELHKEWLFRHV